ncbi:MAG TPA: hypothetical protein VGN12_22535 [Pirellulales bacterium]
MRQTTCGRLVTAIVACAYLNVAFAAGAAEPEGANSAATSPIELPKPTGRYSVGRASYALIDRSRKEIFTADDDDVREFVVIVHYPAQVAADAVSSPYAEERLATAIAEAYHKPASYAQRLRCHAVENAAPLLSTAGFPVVIFSPGFQTHPLFYTATLEDLASQGFVVVSICHTYSTGVTVFPDGRTVRANDAGTQFERDKRDPAISPRTIQDHRDAIGEVWIADVRFVADWLATLNSNDGRLQGSLRLDRLGAFGHSFGGAAAAATVARDERFRAGMNLDGSDFSSTDGEKIREKFLWLCSEPPDLSKLPPGNVHVRREGDKSPEESGKTIDKGAEDKKRGAGAPKTVIRRGDDGSAPPDLTKRRLSTYNGLRAPTDRLITIHGARHQTFASDVVLLAASSPLSKATASQDVGTIEGTRAVKIVNALVSGFFRQQLLGENVPVIDDPAVYPEVHRGPAR